MPIYSKKAFAELCGMPTNSLATYAKRRKVKYSGEQINSDIEPNKSFLSKWQFLKAEREQNLTVKSLTKDIYDAAPGVFDRMLEKIDKEKPVSYVDKLKNEISFEVVCLFMSFNNWTEKQLDQNWLKEKCEAYIKSFNRSIDQIVSGKKNVGERE